MISAVAIASIYSPKEVIKTALAQNLSPFQPAQKFKQTII
jgi:hypothetical protein